MIVDLVKVKAQLEQEKSNLENAKVVLNAVKQAVFMECTKSSEFKQPRQGMASKVVVHGEVNTPNLTWGSWKENTIGARLRLPRKMLLLLLKLNLLYQRLMM